MHYYIIYKPFQMLSQFTKEVEGHITLADLDFDFPSDVYPVGRLDVDSEGLLLLSNDKRLNLILLHPSKKNPKTYWVQVEGKPTEEALKQLEVGVEIRIKGKMHQTLPAKVQRLSAETNFPDREPPIRVRKNIPDTWIEIEIYEGKNRQIRRMCAAVGFPALRLVRVGISGLRLGEGLLISFAPGSVLEIKKESIKG